MPARTKGRAKFDFRGRAFLWWVDRDWYLRILSLDKKFIIAVPLGALPEESSVIEVIGPEFPGLDPAEARPIHLIGPHRTNSLSMGGWVNEVLTWAFDQTHQLIRTDRKIDPMDIWSRA